MDPRKHALLPTVDEDYSTSFSSRKAPVPVTVDEDASTSFSSRVAPVDAGKLPAWGIKSLDVNKWPTYHELQSSEDEASMLHKFDKEIASLLSADGFRHSISCFHNKAIIMSYLAQVDHFMARMNSYLDKALQVKLVPGLDRKGKTTMLVEILETMRAEFKTVPPLLAIYVDCFSDACLRNITYHHLANGESLSVKLAEITQQLSEIQPRIPSRGKARPFRDIWQVPKMWLTLAELQSDVVHKTDALVALQLSCRFLPAIVQAIFNEVLPAFANRCNELKAAMERDLEGAKAMQNKILATSVSIFVGLCSFTIREHAARNYLVVYLTSLQGQRALLLASACIAALFIVAVCCCCFRCCARFCLFTSYYDRPLSAILKTIEESRSEDWFANHISLLVSLVHEEQKREADDDDDEEDAVLKPSGSMKIGEAVDRPAGFMSLSPEEQYNSLMTSRH